MGGARAGRQLCQSGEAVNGGEKGKEGRGDALERDAHDARADLLRRRPAGEVATQRHTQPAIVSLGFPPHSTHANRERKREKKREERALTA